MAFVGIGDGQGNKANVSLSCLEIFNLASTTGFTVSISTGSIRNGPGLLYGYIPTTAGTINFSVNGTPIGAVSGAAGSIQAFPGAIQFTSLSASSSAFVGTIFWRALP